MLTRLSVCQDFDTEAFRDRLSLAANHEVKGSMSQARFILTFASLLLGLVLVYSSIFYVPAFVDMQKNVGQSSEDGKLPQTDNQGGALSNYGNLFKIRRGYLRQGQALILEHDIAPGTVLTAYFSRCSSPPVIEVFYCQNTEKQQISITNDKPGKQLFFMPKPGFYYFDEIVTDANGSKTDTDYKVVWSRKSFTPK